MAEHPIQGIMNVTMDKIHEMVDANTIIGKAITTEDGTTILPVSKVSFGFASGGTGKASQGLQLYFASGGPIFGRPKMGKKPPAPFGLDPRFCPIGRK